MAAGGIGINACGVTMRRRAGDARPLNADAEGGGAAWPVADPRPGGGRLAAGELRTTRRNGALINWPGVIADNVWHI